MNAAETRASSAIADWIALTSVPRSATTAEIDTFMIDVSTTRTNMAIASRTGRRRSAAPAAGTWASTALVMSLPVSLDELVVRSNAHRTAPGVAVVEPRTCIASGYTYTCTHHYSFESGVT